MEELTLHHDKICTKSTEFIFVDSVSEEICDKLVDLYNNPTNLYKVDGKSGYYVEVNNLAKESLDVCIPPNYNHPTVHQYFDELQKVVNKYTNAFPFSEYSRFSMREPMQIQWYPKGGGFKVWHSERINCNIEQIRRHLVFMTYLNDVTDAGETEWYYQKKKIQPKKGLSVIWPPDFTHTHRGIPSPTQEKYIVTGWFNFI